MQITHNGKTYIPHILEKNSVIHTIEEMIENGDIVETKQEDMPTECEHHGKWASYEKDGKHLCCKCNHEVTPRYTAYTVERNCRTYVRTNEPGRDFETPIEEWNKFYEKDHDKAMEKPRTIEGSKEWEGHTIKTLSKNPEYFKISMPIKEEIPEVPEYEASKTYCGAYGEDYEQDDCELQVQAITNSLNAVIKKINNL